MYVQNILEYASITITIIAMHKLILIKNLQMGIVFNKINSTDDYHLFR